MHSKTVGVFWVLSRSRDLENPVHGLRHQVTSEKIFLAFISVSHQILHLADGSVWRRKCHSEKDFLVCRGETKSLKLTFNSLYFCTLSLHPCSPSIDTGLQTLKSSMEREFSQYSTPEECCYSLKQLFEVWCCFVFGTVLTTRTHRALYLSNKSNIFLYVCDKYICIYQAANRLIFPSHVNHLCGLRSRHTGSCIKTAHVPQPSSTHQRRTGRRPRLCSVAVHSHSDNHPHFSTSKIHVTSFVLTLHFLSASSVSLLRPETSPSCCSRVS